MILRFRTPSSQLRLELAPQLTLNDLLQKLSKELNVSKENIILLQEQKWIKVSELALLSNVFK
jgi:hypothetical protein